MALPNPARVLQQKAETLSRVTGADSVGAAFQNLNIGIANGVKEANQALRVLGEGSLPGDLSVGLGKLQQGLGQVDSLLQNAQGLGTALSDPAGFLKGRLEQEISSLTGVLDSATDQLEQQALAAASAFSAGFNVDVPFINAVSGSAIGSTSRAEQKPSGIGKDEFLPNQLRKYASFNSIFKLGAITKFSSNFPDETYRINGSDISILQSGGGGIDGRRVLTVYDALGQQNGTQGNLEYFIDDFEISAVIAPNQRTGMAQATNMSFKVHEPYSMGLFLQSLQAAALETGHQNYLEAPYMLELDFIGWDDEGNPSIVENANRKIPFKLITVEFDVERSGSVYNIEAIPWTEQTLMDECMRIPDPIEIAGTTLLEALSLGEQSLTNIINRALQTKAEAKEDSATDYYIIRFPTQRTSANGIQSIPVGEGTNRATIEDLEQIRTRLGVEATEGLESIVRESLGGYFNSLNIGTNGNALFESLQSSAVSDVSIIGTSSLAFENTRQDSPFGLDRFTYDAENDVYKRNGIEITLSDNGVPKFTFDKDISIQAIIEELVTISNYGRTAPQYADQEGMVRWYKLEPQCFLIDDPQTEIKYGKPAKIFVFNIVPYEVHSSVFSGANSTHSSEERKKQIVKRYDYIYSGQNEDVLAFDLKFNAAFFTSIQGDFGELSAGEQSINVEGVTASNSTPAYNVQANGQGGSVETRIQPVGTSNTFVGGSYNIPAGAALAQQFQRALLDSDVDLVTAEMEIWGDPYYIPDSGLGNYNAPNSGQTSSLTVNGNMDWQRSEVDIVLLFKTPIDYGDDGYMVFPGGELGTQSVGQFSGVYKVLSVVSRISENRFTQGLKLIRRRNQEEYADQLPASGGDAVGESQTARNLNSPNQVERPETVGSAPTTGSTRPSTAVRRPDGVGDTSDLTEIRSASGQSALVAKVVAPNFQALIDELEELGYEIGSMGGYRDPAVAGINQGDGTYSNTVFSWHNSGLAVDINPVENPFIKPRPADAPGPYTDMPANGTGSLMSALAAKHGLGWGGDWSSSIDSMHFSAGPNEGGSFEWERNGTIPRAPQPQTDTTDDARASRTNAEPEAPPPADNSADENDPRGRNQVPVSGTTQVSSTPTASSSVDTTDDARAGRTAASRTAPPATTSASPGNSQISSSDLRPYLPLTPSDNRYDYLTGDKIRSILASGGGGR